MRCEIQHQDVVKMLEMALQEQHGDNAVVSNIELHVKRPKGQPSQFAVSFDLTRRAGTPGLSAVSA